MRHSMKAVVYDSPRQFAVRDVPTPDPGQGEVRIKVAQVGVCGTDVHIHHGDFNAVFPLVPGHELVGTVEALGDGVDRFTLGEQVTVNPNIACGQCDYCRAGRTIVCSSLKGLGTNYPGCFAEFVVVHADLVFSVEGLDPATAVFAEPAACAMHGVESLSPRPGSTALVFGAGPTGLLLAQMLRASGVISVTVAAPTQFKLDTADRLGVDHTVLIDRDDPEANRSKLLEASGTDGYDYVIEASGATSVADICVPLTRNGGTVLVYGVAHPEDVARFEPFDVFRREITIKGSFAEITSFDAAIRALRSGRVKTDGIVTHRFSLADYAEAIDAVEHDRSVHKVVITP
ncbi:MAG: zinc-dependent alcohol dehydrogenase family protein [Ornithinimicrobium sp.]